MGISFFKEEYNPDVYCGVDSTDIIESLNEKMNDVLENRSDRNRWINHFLEFSSMQEIDRSAVVRLIHCICITGKKELEITFNYYDEYRKAVNMVEQMTTERRVG